MNDTIDTLQQFEEFRNRLGVLEQLLITTVSSSSQTSGRETTVEPWRYLVRRQHPWRKQLYIQGRNLTARQLAGSIQANQLDDKKTAENYHLPVEAIREAITYVEKNSAFLTAEAEIERLMSKREEAAHVPQPVG